VDGVWDPDDAIITNDDFLASKAPIKTTTEQSQTFCDMMKDKLSNSLPEQEHMDGHKRYNDVCARCPVVSSTKGLQTGFIREMTPAQQAEFEYIVSGSLFWAFRYQLTVSHGHFLTIWHGTS
jgi:hypothetical protein